MSRELPRAHLKIILAGTTAMGPGKADLLGHIAKVGAIAAVAARMSMSYRRAWMVVRELNTMFAKPLVLTVKGGKGGGGGARG